MTKNNIRIKDLNTLTTENKADIINTIVNSYFQTNDGEVEYTPYLSEIGKIIAISKYIIEGISFDDNESIYNAVTNDYETKKLVGNIISTNEFKNIMDLVNDIVEYKKSETIARIQSEASSVIAYKILELIEKENEKIERESETLNNLNNWINEQRELNSLITPEMQRDFAENFNPESLTDAIIKKYSESDLHAKNKEIVKANKQLREKDNKIIKLENELKKKNQENNVKNVISDK